MEGAGDASIDEALRKAAADAMVDIGGGGAVAERNADLLTSRGVVTRSETLTESLA